MHGQQEHTVSLFSYNSTEEQIPATHSLREVRRLADEALDRLNPTPCRLDPEGGRPLNSVRNALLDLVLQTICAICSE